MTLLLQLGESDDPRDRYLGWSPVPVSVRLSDATGAPVSAVARNRDTTHGGQLVFRVPADTNWSPQVRVQVPGDGTPTTIQIAGRFDFASRRDGDACLEVVPDDGLAAPATMTMMVRVRRDANDLSEGERDLFLDTLASFNDGGAGRFREFREIHDKPGDREMHPYPGFLPWHRAFVLDFERELQAIEPAVALPYWRFDKPAPKVFSPDFMGADRKSARPYLASTNPLTGWVTDQTPGIDRRALRNRDPAFDPMVNPVRVKDMERTTIFPDFAPINSELHSAAHLAFEGFLENLDVSVRDPLFFLLHAGVDHMWAKFQSDREMQNPVNPGAYAKGKQRVGHNLDDTMWPWNQVVKYPRPPHAPGGMLCYSPNVSAPGGQPKVEQMFDYQGVIHAENGLGFAYDDVPFP